MGYPTKRDWERYDKSIVATYVRHRERLSVTEAIEKTALEFGESIETVRLALGFKSNTGD